MKKITIFLLIILGSGWLTEASASRKDSLIGSQYYCRNRSLEQRGYESRNSNNERKHSRKGVSVEPWFILPNISEEERRSLEKLREEDPAKFRQIIKEKKAALRKELKRLKKEDPQKFEKLLKKYRQQQRQFLSQLKESNPKLFRKIVRNRKRRLKKRLEYLKKNDPQEYQRIIQKLRRRRRFKAGRQGLSKKHKKGDGIFRPSSI